VRYVNLEFLEPVFLEENFNIVFTCKTN